MNSLRNRMEGFTLLEAVIAIAILSISVVGIFQTYGGTTLGNTIARDTSLAASFAEEKYEELQVEAAKDWDNLSCPSADADDEYTFTCTLTDTVSAEKLEDENGLLARTATITVTYTNANNVAISQTVSGVLAKEMYGLLYIANK